MSLFDTVPSTIAGSLSLETLSWTTSDDVTASGTTLTTLTIGGAADGYDKIAYALLPAAASKFWLHVDATGMGSGYAFIGLSQTMTTTDPVSQFAPTVQMGFKADGGPMGFQNGDSETVADIGALVTNNVTLVYDGRDIAVYKDGTLVGGYAPGATVTADQFRIALAAYSPGTSMQVMGGVYTGGYLFPDPPEAGSNVTQFLDGSLVIKFDVPSANVSSYILQSPTDGTITIGNTDWSDAGGVRTLNAIPNLTSFAGFVIQAVVGGVNSIPRPLSIEPPTPTVTSATSPADGSIEVQWSYGGPSVAAFNVYYWIQADTTTTDPVFDPTARSYTITGLATGSYYVQVSALDSQSEATGSLAGPVSVTGAAGGGGGGGGVPCFLGNAPVLTPSGYRPISELQVGDHVLTPEGESVPIMEVSVTPNVQNCVRHNPYIVEAGMFGATQDVYISPRHRIMVPGVGLVQARKLGLQQLEMIEPFTYYNLRLDGYKHMVVANMHVESIPAPLKVNLQFSFARAAPAATLGAC